LFDAIIKRFATPIVQFRKIMAHSKRSARHKNFAIAQRPKWH
jgi:hypothetical protein